MDQTLHRCGLGVQVSADTTHTYAGTSLLFLFNGHIRRMLTSSSSAILIAILLGTA